MTITTTTKIKRSIIRPSISKITSSNNIEIDNCSIIFKINYDNTTIVKESHIKCIKDSLLKSVIHKFIHKIEESIKNSFLFDSECKKTMKIEFEIDDIDNKKKFVYNVDASVTNKEMCKISSLIHKAYNELDILKNNEIKELFNFNDEYAEALLLLRQSK
jgi:hypothetical protein